ncbi:MAG: amidase [Planctomycetaceae bacterium]
MVGGANSSKEQRPISSSVSAPQTLTEHLAAVARGEWTATQATAHALNRTQELDSSLHAWVELSAEAALRRAAELDSLSPAIRSTLPLFGVPLGVKDLFDLVGYPTGCGSARLRSGTPASQDAALVALLRQAGGVILGKTVTTHFACFDPPPTVNPWNPDRTPGGSSSGSAVAVATGMCLAALGSQTGGSITRPAAFCGVVGWKPSFGVLSLSGVFPVAQSLDHPGPLVRTAEDLLPLAALFLRSSAGKALSVAEPLDAAPRESLQSAGSPPPNPRHLRCAVVDDDFLNLADADCQVAFQQASARVAESGAPLTTIQLPWSLKSVLALHRRIMTAEIAFRHGPWLDQWPGDYLPAMRGLIREGLQVSETDYRDALAQQRCLCAQIDEILEPFTLWLTPATRGQAPLRTSTGEPTFNAPFSLWGLPTVNLPMGLGADGLPLSLQLAGRRERDAELLRAAVWCERRLGVEPPWM